MECEGSQVDLIVAILVRFPQIGTIYYDPKTDAVRLTFLLKKTQPDFQEFTFRFKSHLTLFYTLKQEEVAVATLQKTDTGPLSALEITRDLASISLSELNLMVELVGDYYRDCLIQEEPAMAEDDQFEQGLLIEALLISDVRRPREGLTGFRDNGRVLVFSVPLGVSES